MPRMRLSSSARTMASGVMEPRNAVIGPSIPRKEETYALHERGEGQGLKCFGRQGIMILGFAGSIGLFVRG